MIKVIKLIPLENMKKMAAFLRDLVEPKLSD